MELGAIDLNLLVALDALLSERSVTRAARRVGLSQPGMSNALGRLRRLLGDPLLVRRGAEMVPTTRALALAGPVHDALELIRIAVAAPAAFDPAAERRTFRLSCSDYSVLMLVGPLLRVLAAEAPAVTVEVIPRLAAAPRALAAGEVDLVVEPAEIMGEVELCSLGLWEDGWACCVWAGNARVGRRLTLARYLELGHLMYSMGGPGQPVALPDRHLERLGLRRRVEASVESFLLAPFLLAGTELVALVPRRAEPFLRRIGEIRILPSPVALPLLREVLWWHPRASADPGHAWLRARIAEVSSGMGSAHAPNPGSVHARIPRRVHAPSG
jgi:LysR family nod box-dependent transcriptional activator